MRAAMKYVDVHGPYRLHDGSTIRVQQVNRHRNGVGGVGFYVVSFVHLYAPARRDPEVVLLGFVPDDVDEDAGRVLVVDPRDLELGFRGADWFGGALRQAIGDWEMVRLETLAVCAGEY